MSEIDKYKAQKEKLENLCDEHSLTYRLDHDGYPITLSLRPMQGMYEQMTMLEDAEDGKGRISQDAVLIFFLKDTEFSHQITGTFTISETLLSKFRNVFKKICSFWMQYYYRETIENHAIKRGLMPVIDEDEAVENEPDQELEAAEAEHDDENDSDSFDEDMITEATQLVRMENKCTLGLLQRRLKLGYAKATALMGVLESRGVVGPYAGSEGREVLPVGVPDDGE